MQNPKAKYFTDTIVMMHVAKDAVDADILVNSGGTSISRFNRHRRHFYDIGYLVLCEGNPLTEGQRATIHKGRVMQALMYFLCWSEQTIK